MRVRVLNRGYWGGTIRDPGEKLEIDDEIMEDEDRRPSWVEPIKTVLMRVDVPADAGDDEDGADAGGGDTEPSLTGSNAASDGTKAAKVAKPRGRKPKGAADAGLEQLPPQTVPDGTGVVEGLGGPAPDWLPSQDDQT